MFASQNPQVAAYTMTPPNPAYIKWVQSIPSTLGDEDFLLWMKANPAPPKTLQPPVSQAIADFIAEEVKKQVAAALTKTA